MPRPNDLPDFRRPPIDEVAIAVQFQTPTPGFVDAHAGRYWVDVIGRYPRAQSVPRIDAAVEPLSGGGGAVPPQLVLPMAFGGQRTFLISADDVYVVQIQDNRFVRNWRRRENAYPHFDELATGFRAELDGFYQFLTKADLQTAPIALLEVTYINWITDLGVQDFLVPARAAELGSAAVSAFPQSQTWQASYLHGAPGAPPTARLSVQNAPAMRATPEGVVQGNQLSLTFSMPGSPTVESAELETGLRDARQAIVESFTALTTPEAHKAWDRIQ